MASPAQIASSAAIGSAATASASALADAVASFNATMSEGAQAATTAVSNMASALPSAAAGIFNASSPSASPINAGEETSNGQGINIVAIAASLAAAALVAVVGVVLFRRRAAKNKGTVLPGKREGDAPRTPTRGTPARTAVRQGDQQADFTLPARGTDLSPDLRRRRVGANATPNRDALLPTGGTGQLSPGRGTGVGAAAAYRTPNRNQDTRTAGDEEGGGSGDTGSTGDDRAALLRSPAAATATATPRRAWFSPAGLAESIGGVISPIRDKVASLFAGSPDSLGADVDYAAASQTPTDGSSVSSATREGAPRVAREATPLPPVIPPARHGQRPAQQRRGTAQTPESSPVPPPGSIASPTSTTKTNSSVRGRGARRARGNRGAKGGNQGREPWKSPASPTYPSTPDHHKEAVKTVVKDMVKDRPPSAQNLRRPNSGRGGAVVTVTTIKTNDGRTHKIPGQGTGGRGNIVHGEQQSPRSQALAGSPAAPSPSGGTGSLGYSLRNEEDKKGKGGEVKDGKGKGGEGGGTRRILVAPRSYGLAAPGFPGGMETIQRPVATKVGASVPSAAASPVPSAKASAAASAAASSSVTTKFKGYEFDAHPQSIVGGVPVWRQHPETAGDAAETYFDEAPAAASTAAYFSKLYSGGELTTPQDRRLEELFVTVDAGNVERVINEKDMELLSPYPTTPGNAPTSATVAVDASRSSTRHSLT